jgi:acyl-CoA synthetase (NDP forming)/GNAT superfamily N-acetyltransferase
MTGAAAAPSEGAGVHALLAEGTMVEIRHAVPGDFAAVRAMHEGMSAESSYLRFFGFSRQAAEQEARRLTREPGPDHAALLALLHGEPVGAASYECTGDPGVAEIAFAVADRMHGQGIATLLLEHLVSLARSRGVRSFTAEILPENRAMLNVFEAAGLPAERRAAEGTIEVIFPLPRGGADLTLDAYLDAVAVRERRADVASLRSLLAPRSVAVVGASRQPGTVGRAILHSIVSGGFAEREGHKGRGGRVYAVNPGAPRIEGVESVPSPLALPEPVDLAVVAVPAAEVLTVAEECGQRGVRALVVITSGVDAATGAALLATCRRHGMRLAGPDCFGVAVPGIGLNATFAARHPVPGRAGLVVQSGGVGVAVLGHLSRLGIGVSSFASLGDKYDVSGNDLLLWWEQDEMTDLAVLHLESFGNPRKFARTARRVSRQMPVLTVHAGEAAVGTYAAVPAPGVPGRGGNGPGDSGPGIAAVATDPAARQALFEQAGIIAAGSFGELLDTVALVAAQPLPAGRRVAVVTNAREGGVMAAAACADAGLQVTSHSEATRRAMAEVLPPGAATAGPVATVPAVAADPFRRCLELAAADDGTDALLALVVPNAVADLLPAITSVTLGKPLAAVVLNQPEAVALLRGADGERGADGGTRPVPAYVSPESAARALAHAARYQAWRTRPGGQVPRFSDLRDADARELVRAFLARMPGGGWLGSADAARLLGCYGIPLASGDKAAAPGTRGWPGVHGGPGGPAREQGPATAAGAGGTWATETAGRIRPREATGRSGAEEVEAGTTGTRGTGVIVGVVQEPMFGPLVVFGLAGLTAEVLADRVARLAPLARADATEMIHAIRAAPLLLGHKGAPAADLDALADLLLRVSRLADDLPDVAQLDLSPVIAQPSGVLVTQARIRVAPAEPADPFLRKLR